MLDNQTFLYFNKSCSYALKSTQLSQQVLKMKKIKTSNISYVFSQTTLDIAIDEWSDNEQEKHPEKESALQITKAALPWFMQHLKQTESIYMFTDEVMIDEMDIWKSLQIAEYPKQKQRIEETCKLLKAFFHSEVVLQHKMVVSPLESFTP